ncbi:MAG: hypothetical protein J5772_05995 [Clostridia bacterium]|nr:hypothetical protein [Clostridia bacterium]
MNADEVVSAIKGAAASISATNIGAGMLHVAANMYDLDPAANAEGYFNHFVSTGSYAWTVDGDSVVSGNAGVNNSTSTLITRVSVGYEETLTFDYKVSSEEGADYLRVKVNGTTVFETSGEHDWDTASVTIPGYGSAEITFEYKKNASGAAGSDKAWIRNVKVDGSLSSAANITGGTEIFSSSGEYPWVADRAEHAAKSGNAGVDNSTSSMTVSLELKKAMIVKFKYKVSAASGDRFTFLDNDRIALNSGATEGYVEYEYSVPSTGMHTFTFTFTKNASGSSGDDCAYVKCFYYIHSFESAINGSDNFLPFINDGEYPWVAAGDAASSSNWGEANSQSDLLLELPMNAGETLTFKYRASSESNYDFLRFYVDGTQMFQQSGNNTNWTTYTFTATSTKTYVFKWSYQKDYSADTNDDCGYVKEVVYSGVYVVANGDADDDGDVDSADALLILRYAMGLVDESQIDLTKSDVDGNGIVDSADALIVLRRTMGVSDR